MVHQHLLWQHEEKEYQLHGDHSKSTIQLVDQEKQKMREGVESLRTQQVVQLKAEHGHKEISKEMNPTGMKTDDAMDTLPDGMNILEISNRCTYTSSSFGIVGSPQCSVSVV